MYFFFCLGRSRTDLLMQRVIGSRSFANFYLRFYFMTSVEIIFVVLCLTETVLSITVFGVIVTR